MNLVALQFQTTSSFKNNLSKLVSLIKQTPIGAYIVAPELVLSGYAYDRLDEAANITIKAKKILLDLSSDRTITITMTTKKDNKYFNTLYIFHKNKIVHTQSKAKLFLFGDEDQYFTSGTLNDIKIIDIDGLKVGALICFELRFIDIWKKLQGADIIFIPAMWGKIRKENFETLTQAIAVINQCFVCASDSSNDDMASSSGIISPFGETLRDDTLEIISQKINLNEIKKMRRYMKVGIN